MKPVVALLFATFATLSMSINAQETIQLTGTPTELYTEDSHPSEYCIALNVYYEARADSLAGKYAVADVVLNRAADKRYPDTACKVTQQGKQTATGAMIKNKCQFSWYCDGKPDIPTNPEAWRESQIIAYQIYQLQRMRGLTDGATHYHATYVSPNWAPTLNYNGQIGSHLFYRWVK